MGRRTRKKRSDSTGGVFEDLLFICKEFPAAGLLIGALLCGLGAYLDWLNPRSMRGFGPIVGMVAFFAGALCIFSGVVGLIKNRSAASGAKANQVSGAWTLETVRGMTWQEFERLVADLFRRQGYTVKECSRDAQLAGTGDGGVDLILLDAKAPGAEFLVQCKHYKAWDVGEPKVREFYGAMAAWRTRCEGFIVTCGSFTQPAKDFATGKPLRLIDGNGLLLLLNQQNAIAPPVQIQASAAVQAASIQGASTATTQSASHEAPVCPACRVAMVRRIAGKGQRAGLPFWGCSNYPACKMCIDIVQ